MQAAGYRLAKLCTLVIDEVAEDVTTASLVFAGGTSEEAARQTAAAFFRELTDQELREKIREETQAVRALILAQCLLSNRLGQPRMSELKPAFRAREEFEPQAGYQLLPFRFNRLDGRYVVTNDVGEYALLDRAELVDLVELRLPRSSPAYRELKAKHILLDGNSRVALDLLALKYRSRTERLAEFTALHMFVVTLRCDHSCQYCQVSRQTEDRAHFDMSVEHANAAVDFVFRSPAKNLKIEFQGGEPLLNFPLIRHVVERARELNAVHQRNLQFVIASNLTRLSDDILEFCLAQRVFLSTSIDGPKDLHDAQRPLRGGSSYERVVAGVHRARATLGADAVSALMTTTPAALDRVEEIVDEYVRLGFHSIFLRNLSPFGFAAKSLVHRYDVEAWVEFFKRGLMHVIKKNVEGHFIREEYTSLLMQKLFSPMAAGYVDLQSPAGIGIAGIVYNYDGAVYASDEGRMLAEMGDTTFRLGHLGTDSYESIMTSERLLGPLEATVLESVPQCTDCAFLPYCGADPVFHQATQGDWVGHKAFSSFCAKQTALIGFLVQLLESDPVARQVLIGWTSCS